MSYNWNGPCRVLSFEIQGAVAMVNEVLTKSSLIWCFLRQLWMEKFLENPSSLSSRNYIFLPCRVICSLNFSLPLISCNVHATLHMTDVFACNKSALPFWFFDLSTLIRLFFVFSCCIHITSTGVCSSGPCIFSVARTGMIGALMVPKSWAERPWEIISMGGIQKHEHVPLASRKDV